MCICMTGVTYATTTCEPPVPHRQLLLHVRRSSNEPELPMGSFVMLHFNKVLLSWGVVRPVSMCRAPGRRSGPRPLLRRLGMT